MITQVTTCDICARELKDGESVRLRLFETGEAEGDKADPDVTHEEVCAECVGLVRKALAPKSTPSIRVDRLGRAAYHEGQA